MTNSLGMTSEGYEKSLASLVNNSGTTATLSQLSYLANLMYKMNLPLFKEDIVLKKDWVCNYIASLEILDDEIAVKKKVGSKKATKSKARSTKSKRSAKVSVISKQASARHSNQVMAFKKFLKGKYFNILWYADEAWNIREGLYPVKGTKCSKPKDLRPALEKRLKWFIDDLVAIQRKAAAVELLEKENKEDVKLLRSKLGGVIKEAGLYKKAVSASNWSHINERAAATFLIEGRIPITRLLNKIIISTRS